MAELLRAVVATTFQGTQSSATSYLALSQNLKEQHEHAIANGLAAEFEDCFVRCMNRVLTAQRKERCATRVLDFVTEYFRLVCPTDDGLDDNEFVDFAEDVIAHFLRGFEARLSGVRYWCVLIVSSLLPLVALSEDMLAEIRDKAVLRLRDADARVRVQAVVLLARFDLEPETSEPLEIALQHDPSSEVRLAVAYNLAHGGKRLAERVSERVRDESPAIRKALYTKVLRSIDFRVLGLRCRENVARSGLVDRDPAVRQAAAQLIANSWVATAESNIELVLQRLDVLTHQDVADLVLEAFFDVRRDVLEEKLVFGDEFWENLWVEDVVLLRNFQSYCQKHGLAELLDERMPELARLAGHIERLWNQFQDPDTYVDQTEEQAEDIRDCLPFMVEQLLLVAGQYDYRDEVSRRRTTEVLNNIVMAQHPASHGIIENIVAIQRLLNESDMALMSWAFETLEAIADMAPSRDEAPSTQQESEELLTSMLRGLSLFKAVLSRVSSRDLSAYLPTLYSQYLLQSLQSPIADIREPALECLALACLLDEKFAAEHIHSFMAFVKTALEAAPEEDVAMPDDDDFDYGTRELHLATNAITDMLLVHFRSELPLEDCLDLLQKLIQKPSRAVKAVSALNLAKLMLAKLVSNEQTLGALTLLNFQCDDGSDSRAAALLQQQLNLFLRAYALYPEGKMSLANVFKSTVIEFREAAILHAQWQPPASSPRRRRSVTKTSDIPKYGRVSIADVVSQMLDLTAEEPDKPAEAHCKMAVDLVQLLFEMKDTNVRRSLVAALNKLLLTPQTPLQYLQSINSVLYEQNWDVYGLTSAVRVALHKFGTTVQQVIQAAAAAEEQERAKSAYVLGDLAGSVSLPAPGALEQPGTPAHVEPVDAGTPVEPRTPVDPRTPGQSGTRAEPITSTQSGTPVTPNQVGTPARFATPVQAGSPVQPKTPIQAMQATGGERTAVGEPVPHVPTTPVRTAAYSEHDEIQGEPSVRVQAGDGSGSWVEVQGSDVSMSMEVD